PFRVSARVAAWIGKAASRPCFAKARTRAAGTPRSAKDGAASGCCALGVCVADRPGAAPLRALRGAEPPAALRGAEPPAALRGAEPRWSDGRAGAVVMKNLHGSVVTAEAVVHSAARPHPCPRWRARSIAARTPLSRTRPPETKNVSGLIPAPAPRTLH